MSGISDVKSALVVTDDKVSNAKTVQAMAMAKCTQTVKLVSDGLVGVNTDSARDACTSKLKRQ